MSVLFLTLFSLITPPVQVVVDPGHGGSNLGALAHDGTHEKVLTLDLAHRLSRALTRRGITHRLTRRTDRYLTLLQRTEFAAKWRANCFISLHFNASTLHNRSGIEIFYPKPSQAAALGQLTSVVRTGRDALKRKGSLGTLIVDSYITTLERSVSKSGSMVFAKKLAWRLLADGFSIRSIKGGDYDVLLGSGTKAILFEGGFIDNKKDKARPLSAESRERMARSMARGLAALCKTDSQLF